MKIGIISDTHVYDRSSALPPQIHRVFSGVDLILHAGDLTSMDVLSELETIAPVEAVAGNIDDMRAIELLGTKKIIETGGCRIGLFHGFGEPLSLPSRVARNFSDDPVSYIVFGHTHTPYNERLNGTLLFNPGTTITGAPRMTVGILSISNGTAEGAILDI